MNKDIRVRFAPSPTGGLHIGGVRTVLYNYLFAKQNNGKFIVRIEDTDQTRFVPGAEEYIFNTLNWCGITPNESVVQGGEYGPYKQSERKSLYKKYAEELIQNGYAYYAFDTPAELETLKRTNTTETNPNPQYDATVRLQMCNSLTLPIEVTQEYLSSKPYVIRIKIPQNETVTLQDIIRGEVSFNTSLLDDKVLLKSDGMPTYHLAVVVDDYLMKISHAFRGEEWLPSAPVHVLLWKYLFGLDNMPQWAHFPLILGPHGKLSKRDGAKYGFPVFAMNWENKTTHELTEGFKEKGFLPEAFINLLAMLGWNDGTEQEIFTLNELIEKFSLERVQSSGAKFDYEKAIWYNHEWIKKLSAENLLPYISPFINHLQLPDNNALLVKIIYLVKDRCKLLSDFAEQIIYFYKTPTTIDTDAIMPKWNKEKHSFFKQLIRNFQSTQNWQVEQIENCFQITVTANFLKPGEVMMPLRIMLVGGKFGPGIFHIAELLTKDETILRIENALLLIDKQFE